MLNPILNFTKHPSEDFYEESLEGTQSRRIKKNLSRNFRKIFQFVETLKETSGGIFNEKL